MNHIRINALLHMFGFAYTVCIAAFDVNTSDEVTEVQIAVGAVNDLIGKYLPGAPVGLSVQAIGVVVPEPVKIPEPLTNSLDNPRSVIEPLSNTQPNVEDTVNTPSASVGLAPTNSATVVPPSASEGGKQEQEFIGQDTSKPFVAPNRFG